MSERVFQHQVRVRYAETDAQQVAHHSAYVPWLEEARIEALREVGYSYRELEASGIFMPVTALNIRYKRSASFDDHIDLETTVAPDGRFTIAFATRIMRGEELLAEAAVTVAVLDDGGKLQRIPSELRTSFGWD